MNTDGPDPPPTGFEETTSRWTMQRAADAFEQLVQQAVDLGPQKIETNGKPVAYVVSESFFGCLQGLATGQNLIDTMQSMPHADSWLDRGEGLSLPDQSKSPEEAREAIARLRANRSDVLPGDASSFELRIEGRR